MNMVNATLTELAPPPPPDGNGGFTSPAYELVNVPCFVDQPTRAQLIAASGRSQTITDMIYVSAEKLGAVTPQPGGMARFSQRGVTRAARIESVTLRELRNLSHYELALRAL